MLIGLFSIGHWDIRILDILDIAIAAYLVYFIYKYVKGSAAVNIFIGVILFLVLLTAVKELNMRLLSLILGSIAGIGLISIIVIFQPEIRRFLLMIGNKTMKGRFSFLNKYLHMIGIYHTPDYKLTLGKILKIVTNLSASKTGAILVITKSDVPTLVNSGQIIDSIVNVKLVESIFFKNSPLHDGAVIIMGDRILAASCILPVSANENLPPLAGLRHRAALGVSEGTENISIVVSEENGMISYASNGQLFHHISIEQLKFRLDKYFDDGHDITH